MVIKDIDTILLNMKILSDVAPHIARSSMSQHFGDLHARCVEAPVVEGG